jgi:hypothetical protein
MTEISRRHFVCLSAVSPFIFQLSAFATQSEGNKKDGEGLVILLGGGSKRRLNADISAALACWQDYPRRKRCPVSGKTATDVEGSPGKGRRLRVPMGNLQQSLGALGERT